MLSFFIIFNKKQNKFFMINETEKIEDLEEGKNTTTVSEDMPTPPIVDVEDSEDDGFGGDEESNLIIPQKCVGGKSPIVVHLKNKLEIKEQGASRMKVISFGIIQPSRQAVANLKIPFPNETADAKLVTANKSRIKQFLNTFL